MPGRLVHDGTIRRVGESPLDDGGAAAEAAASFFRFVASQLSGNVDSDALLNEYMHITGVGPPDAKPSGKGLSAAEYAALQQTKYTTKGPTECPVCLTSFRLGDACKLLPCQHLFCERCTKRWMDSNTTCPLCRRDCRFADVLALNEQRRRARAMPASLEPLAPLPLPPPTPPPAASPVPPSPRARQAPRARPVATHARSARLSAAAGGGDAARPLHALDAGVTATAYVAPARRPTPSPRGTVRLASPRAVPPRAAPHRPAFGSALEAGGALGSPRWRRQPHPHRPPRERGHAAPSPRSETAGASLRHHRPQCRDHGSLLPLQTP